MGLGATALILLGFVVSVAARSRPGGPGDEALLDVEIDLGFDLTRILAWVILILAMLGAVALVLGVKEAKPREDKRKRNLWAIVLGLLVFFVALRYLRPLAEGLFEPADAAEAADSAIEDPTAQAAGSSAWLFSILIAAVFVAALTRVGLTVRSTDGSFDTPPPEESLPSFARWGDRPITLALGNDPRSRVLVAYSEFENATAVRGVGRRLAETARHHARRVIKELHINSNDVSALVSTFALTRFGGVDITTTDAESAELLSAKLRQELIS
jgi:hypothetical protein